MEIEKRKVWFIPTEDKDHCRGYFSKEIFFDIRYNTIHNPTGYTLTCPYMKLGNYKLFSSDMETAKAEALKAIQKTSETFLKQWFCDLVNKYEI